MWTWDKLGMKQFVVCSLFAGGAVLHATNSLAAPRGTKALAAGACEDFALPAELASLQVSGSDSVGESYPFAKLFEPDFLQKHPSVALNANQRGAALLRYFGTTRVVDPVYKVKTYDAWNLFHGGVAAANGSYIEGQFQASEVFGNRVLGAAQGGKGSQALVFYGPPGTGKTLLTTILTTVNSHLAMSEATPQFHQFSYRWQNLNKILDNEGVPGLIRARLSPYVDKFGTLRSRGMERSPLSILPADVQLALVKNARSSIQNLVGFDLAANLERNLGLALDPDPHARDLVEKILIPAYRAINKKSGPLSAQDYVNAISPYVTITRRYVMTGKESPSIIQPLGEFVDLAPLLGKKSVASMMAAESDALGFDYTGPLSQSDGAFATFDDGFRNTKAVLDLLLNLIQDSRFGSSDVPNTIIDAILTFSANDSSLADLASKMDTKAFKHRLERAIMPEVLHPNSIAAVLTQSVGYRTFRMKALGPNQSFVPYNPRVVFPLPDERGNQLGLQRRYVLDSIPTGSQKEEEGQARRVLIAPHALDLIVQTASASRFNVNREEIRDAIMGGKILSEDSRYLTDPIVKLRIALGDETLPNNEVRGALSEISSRLHEGFQGIPSRDLEAWFKSALALAEKKGSALTVVEVIAAFKEIQNTDGFKLDDQSLYGVWADLLQRVSLDVILGEVYADVVSIIGGETASVDAMYAEVLGELRALATNSSASEYRPRPGAESKSINKTRMRDIRKIFHTQQGRDLDPTEMTTFFGNAYLSGEAPTVSGSLAQWTPLRDAIRAYLVDKQMDLVSLEGYFQALTEPDSNAVAPEISEKIPAMQAAFVEKGYDQASFAQALRFLISHRDELERRKQE